MKQTALLIITLLVTAFAHAEVSFTASGPSAVVVGDDFRVAFTLNVSDGNGRFTPPSSFGEFQVLFGPSTSSSTSVQIINGKTSKNSSYTYSYVLTASKEGTFTIPAASVEVGGKTYQSNTLKIKVLPAGQQQPSQGGSGQGATRPRTQTSGERISGRDLFIGVTASKKRVYEQEAVVLTYKVYTLVNLTQLAGDMPDLDGFHTQEIPLPNNKTFTMEHVNGVNYQTVVWRQYVLFPQRAGTFTVPEVKFDGVVVQQNRNIDPFEAFFNGVATTVEVNKTIIAPALTLQVDPLPERPANFSGAVGSFTMDAAMSPDQLKTNDALTVKLTVKGTGNMKLMKAPEVKFPKDFDTYDVKSTDATSIGRNGASGTKTFEYLAVPRHGGKFQIPPVEFCYFDLDSKSYKTLTSQPFEVTVEKGAATASASADYTTKEELKVLGSDIHFIKQGDATLRPAGAFFFGTMIYALCYLIPLCLFGILLFIFRKQAIENANVAKVRGKKANKVAIKRLKTAKNLLDAGKKEEFYDELTRALWGYVGDKLNISTSELTRDNVEERLAAKGVQDELIAAFLSVLDDSEFARYAPGDAGKKKDRLYAKATEVISKMESSMK